MINFGRELYPLTNEQYDAAYYESEGYSRENPVWKPFFGHVADEIIRRYQPRTALDAGCAVGLLVEELRDRGVDARGFDFSDFAINSIPPEIRPYCYVHSITSEIDGQYDFISCIEVLEHLPEDLAQTAVANLCRHADIILFSSTPDDFEEPTHLNVREGDYWADLFANEGFFRDFEDDVARNVSPQAVVFRRSAQDLSGAIRGYEALLTHRSIDRQLQESTLLRQRAELREQLEAANLQHGLAKLEIRDLNHYKKQVEDFERTLLFKFTARPRDLYARVRRLRNPKFMAEESITLKEIYASWIADYEPLLVDLMNARMQALPRHPLISVVMPTFNISAEYLNKAVHSVLNQSYPNWELCIADDCSTNEATIDALKEIQGLDDRIKVIFRDTNGHISAASNSALEIASGEWVALLDHDDELPPHALATFAVTIAQSPRATLLYSDRDMIDDTGQRFQPYFKPDFDPELILSLNYLCHLTLLKRSLVDQLGGFRLGIEGSQDWDLSLRTIAASDHDQIVHVPHVLYHWRLHPGSVSTSLGVKPYAAMAAKKAIVDYLSATNRPAEVAAIDSGGWYQITWALPPSTARIALIIDRSTGLDPRARDLIGQTKTTLSDVIVLDASSPAGSPGETKAFSARVNEAIERVDADFVCVVRAGYRPADPNWLNKLLRYAAQPDVGVVGPSVISSDKTFVHTGVIVGLDGGAGELYRGVPHDSAGVYGRLIVTRGFSAVDRSCMVIDKRAWSAVGGFDETNTPEHFASVDFCLRLSERGWRTLWTPFAQLIATDDQVPSVPAEGGSYEAERSYLNQRWAAVALNDPHFNPNLLLASLNDGFHPASPPRVLQLELAKQR